MEPVLTENPSVRVLSRVLCAPKQVRRVRDAQRVTRTAKHNHVIIAVAMTIVGIAGGATLVSTADSYPRTSDGDELTQSEARAWGTTGILAGFAGAFWTTGIAIGARDTTSFSPWRTEERTLTARPCTQFAPVKQTIVALEVGGEVVAKTQTDDRGIASFHVDDDMAQRAPAALRTATARATKHDTSIELDVTSYGGFERAKERVAALAEQRRRAARERAELERKREERRRAEAAERARRERLRKLAAAGAAATPPYEGFVRLRATGPVDLLDPNGPTGAVPADTRVFVFAKSPNLLGVVVAPDVNSPPPADGSLLDVVVWIPPDSVLSPAEYTKWRKENYVSANIQGALLSDAEKIIQLLELDVLGFYDLEDEHDTPLKRKVFRKSADYREKKKTLRQARQALRSARVYTVGNTGLGTYDLKRKRFEIQMSTSLADSAVDAAHPGCYDGTCFDSLPVHTEAVYYRGKKLPVSRHLLRLRIPENQAVLIENQQIDIYFVYTPARVQRRTIRFHDGSRKRKTSRKFVIAKDVTILIAKEGSDELIWSADY